MNSVFALWFSFISILSCSFGQNFTAEEILALRKFRAIVHHTLEKPEDRNDNYLMSYLKAKDLDVSEAAELLRESQEWRKEYRIDGIENETILEITPSPFEFSGYARDGTPIAVASPAVIDIRKYILQGNSDKLRRYMFQAVERAANLRKIASKKFGKDITQIILVVDFQGYNIKQHGCLLCLPFLRDLFGMERNYPGVVKYIVAVNVPRIAFTFINLVKPMLSPPVQKNMKIFSTDRKQWKEYFSKIAELDQIPYRFGGIQKSKVQ